MSIKKILVNDQSYSIEILAQTSDAVTFEFNGKEYHYQLQQMKDRNSSQFIFS